jgi:hypothetical protein
LRNPRSLINDHVSVPVFRPTTGLPPPCMWPVAPERSETGD